MSACCAKADGDTVLATGLAIDRDICCKNPNMSGC